jgi:hypothetical protein
MNQILNVRELNIALYICWIPVLGMFTKLQKVTLAFVMSVHPSAWNTSAPTGWIFMKFDI